MLLKYSATVLYETLLCCCAVPVVLSNVLTACIMRREKGEEEVREGMGPERGTISPFLFHGR